MAFYKIVKILIYIISFENVSWYGSNALNGVEQIFYQNIVILLVLIIFFIILKF